MIRFFAKFGEWHLVGAPGIFHRFPIHKLGSGPALGRAHDEHWPCRAIGGSAFARGLLYGGDAIKDRIEDCSSLLVHRSRGIAFERERLVAVTPHPLPQLGT